MTPRYRPKAPKGTHWEGDALVADNGGPIEMSLAVWLALKAYQELVDGSEVVNGRVAARFWVEVEEVPCTK